MKLKKKAKKILIGIVIIVALVMIILFAVRHLGQKESVKEARVLNKIDEYNYVLKDTKSKQYQELFKELVKILKEDPVDEEKYASKISEMFIVDFYSLNDKTAKTDIGGVDFIHPDVLVNFLENAENTFYKNVESNIYNNRNQKLPTIDTVQVDSVEKTLYEYNEKSDAEAYVVKVSWTYTEEDYSDYQNKASLVFVHEDNKLYLVELA